MMTTRLLTRSCLITVSEKSDLDRASCFSGTQGEEEGGKIEMEMEMYKKRNSFVSETHKQLPLYTAIGSPMIDVVNAND